MTLKQAFLKVKKLQNRDILSSCIDIGHHWVFIFRSKKYSDEKDVPMGMGVYDVVNKVTGTISQKSVGDLINKLLKAKEIDVNQFNYL